MATSGVLRQIESLSNEKDLSLEDVFQVMEESLAAAVRPLGSEESEILVEIDRETGDRRVRLQRLVVADDRLKNYPYEISLSDARSRDAEVEIHSKIEDLVEFENFSTRGRSQRSKQILKQKLDERKRIRLAEEYSSRVGELLRGVVKETREGFLVVDLARGAEGILPRRNMIGKEFFRKESHVQALLKEIQQGARGPVFILDRCSKEMLLELFLLEVPEIRDGLVEIKAVARRPGEGSKIAVRAQGSRLDPVGTCVGMRGSRVQQVSSALSNERIDIVPWDDDPLKMLKNALGVEQTKESRRFQRRRRQEEDEVIRSLNVGMRDGAIEFVEVGAAPERIGDLIGKEALNVILASELLGYRIDILSEEEASARRRQRIENFMSALDVDEDIARALEQGGFASLDDLAEATKGAILELGFDDENATELLARAKQLVYGEGMDESKARRQRRIEGLIADLDVDEDIARVLERAGFPYAGALAKAAKGRILELRLGFDDDDATELLTRAKRSINTRYFTAALDAEEALIGPIVAAGYESLQQIVDAGPEKLATIEVVGEGVVGVEIAEEIINRAQAFLQSGLMDVKKMDKNLASLLIGKGVITRDDLADCATDELIELLGEQGDGIDEKAAGDLIMAARAHWFTEEEQGDMEKKSAAIASATVGFTR